MKHKEMLSQIPCRNQDSKREAQQEYVDKPAFHCWGSGNCAVECEQCKFKSEWYSNPPR